MVPARASPHLQHPHRCSGLMLANHTAVRHTLDKTVAQFDTLFQRKVTLWVLQGPRRAVPGRAVLYCAMLWCVDIASHVEIQLPWDSLAEQCKSRSSPQVRTPS